MMVVGSTLTHYDKVTGIFYAKRSNRSDRLSLWLSSNDREICRQSELEWLEMLQKVNQEGFNIGIASFTNHKGSGHHHRDNRGDNRGDRGGGDHREHRDHRDNRGEREYRDNRDNRDSRDNRDTRDNRDNRESRDGRGDRRPSGPNKFSSRGGFGGPRQSSEGGRSNDWNRR